MQQPDADLLPCPGRRSPVRPLAVVPVCKSCALRSHFAELGPHRAPVAKYTGMRWECASARPVQIEAVSPLDAASCLASSLPPAPGGAGGSSPL